MALKKLCRCGKLIDYTDKHCSECEKKVDQEKRARVRRYDREVRNSDSNKRYVDFYNSKAWRTLSEVIRRKYNGLCVYDYYINNKITDGYICHHLREIKKDGWENRLNANMIIYLSHQNHELIHRLYEKDYEGTVRMLEGLIEKFNSEFK